MSVLEYTTIFEGVDPAYIAPINVLVLGCTVCLPIWHLAIRPFAKAYESVVGAQEKMALSDPLTGLNNRRAFIRELSKIQSELNRHGGHAALLLFDLDKFKPINDEFGHEAGDQVLVQVAKRIASAIRREDSAARIGGDEFVVVCTRLDQERKNAREQAATIAEKLAEEIPKPIYFQSKCFEVGVSIGFGLVCSRDQLDSDDFFAAVDQAMYRAKQLGDGTISFVDDLETRQQSEEQPPSIAA